jgi:hypothetical protein
MKRAAESPQSKTGRNSAPALLVELNELLEEKERRLQSQGNPTGKPTSK